MPEATVLSTVRDRRVQELVALRNAHNSQALALQARGRPLSAWQATQAALTVDRKLATIQRKLLAIDYVRRFAAPEGS